MRFARCPRCNFQSYEVLATHGYCVDCNYSPDLDPTKEIEIPDWAIQAIREGFEATEAKESNALSLPLSLGNVA